MPYPSQINPEKILITARQLLEEDGADRLTLKRIATALGVKTPSLYRYFQSRTALLHGINQETSRLLTKTLKDHAKAASSDTKTQLIEVCIAYRDFVHTNPNAYGLAYTNVIPELGYSENEAGEAAILQSLVEELVDNTHTLTVLYGLWALIHGFVMLELTEQFRHTNNLDETYQDCIKAYLNDWT